MGNQELVDRLDALNRDLAKGVSEIENEISDA
jgi:hypothetical protein